MNRQIEANHKFLQVYGSTFPNQESNRGPARTTNPNIHEEKGQPIKSAITTGSTHNTKLAAELK